MDCRVQLSFQDCDHCRTLRLKSLEERGFPLLLREGEEDGPQRLRIVEIHFDNITANQEVVEFALTDLDEEGEMVRQVYSRATVSEEEWFDLLTSHIPVRLRYYAYSCPCRLTVTSNEWQKGLEGHPFYAAVTRIHQSGIPV